MSAQAATADSAADAPKKKKSKLGLIIAVVVLLAGGTAAGLLVPKMLHKDGAAKPKAEAPKPPVFVNMDSFTVNLADDGSSEHYLQTSLVFEVKNDKVTDAIKVHLPAIRGKILLLLSSKTPGSLATIAGKDSLATEILEVARAPLATDELKEGIVGVHYAAFVIQ